MKGLMELIDAAGIKKALVSISATIASFELEETLQLIAIGVAIFSGVMAIRHYAVSIALNKAKLSKLHGEQLNGESCFKNDHNNEDH